MTWTFTPRSFARTKWSTIDGVLVSFVLHEQGVFRLLDELANPVAAPVRAPDEVRGPARFERLAAPVGIETFENFRHFVRVRRNDGELACLLEIIRVPV